MYAVAKTTNMALWRLKYLKKLKNSFITRGQRLNRLELIWMYATDTVIYLYHA